MEEEMDAGDMHRLSRKIPFEEMKAIARCVMELPEADVHNIEKGKGQTPEASYEIINKYRGMHDASRKDLKDILDRAVLDEGISVPSEAFKALGATHPRHGQSKEQRRPIVDSSYTNLHRPPSTNFEHRDAKQYNKTAAGNNVEYVSVNQQYPDDGSVEPHSMMVPNSLEIEAAGLPPTQVQLQSLVGYNKPELGSLANMGVNLRDDCDFTSDSMPNVSTRDNRSSFRHGTTDQFVSTGDNISRDTVRLRDRSTSRERNVAFLIGGDEEEDDEDEDDDEDESDTVGIAVQETVSQPQSSMDAVSNTTPTRDTCTIRHSNSRSVLPNFQDTGQAAPPLRRQRSNSESSLRTRGMPPIPETWPLRRRRTQSENVAESASHRNDDAGVVRADTVAETELRIHVKCWELLKGLVTNPLFLPLCTVAIYALLQKPNINYYYNAQTINIQYSCPQ